MEKRALKIKNLPFAVTHYCFEVPTDANQVQIQTRILINDDPVNSVYAFDATSGDTSLLTDRTTDADCIKDQTGIVDTSTDPILYDFTVTTTDASHKCGVSVVSVIPLTKKSNSTVLTYHSMLRVMQTHLLKMTYMLYQVLYLISSNKSI